MDPAALFEVLLVAAFFGRDGGGVCISSCVGALSFSVSLFASALTSVMESFALCTNKFVAIVIFGDLRGTGGGVLLIVGLGDLLDLSAEDTVPTGDRIIPSGEV